MLREGSAAATLVVAEDDTAIALGSGDVPVLGTPRLVALMELAARTAARQGLEEGRTTVGTAVAIEHLAPTPVGGTVTAQATITARADRRIDFELVATDGHGVVVGRGTHQRAVVGRESFIARLPKP